MSEDEILVMITAIICGGTAWFCWYLPIARVDSWPPAGGIVKALCLAPLACLGGLFLVLVSAASYDVVDAPRYIVFYLAVGGAWLGLVRTGLAFMGILLRDDALERGNRAAAISLITGLMGLTACFAGANIGDGPGWWCVLYPAGLATATWFALLAGFQAATKVADKVTIERDEAAAIRHGGLMIAVGLVCGRAAAGDWTSAAATLVEFSVVLPAVLLTVLAVFAEGMFRPEGVRREPGQASQRWSSLTLAFVYVLLALAYIGWSLPLPANPMYRSEAKVEGRE